MNLPTLSKLVELIKKIFDLFDKFLEKLGIKADWDKLFTDLAQ